MAKLVAAGAVWLAFGLVYLAALYHMRKIWLRGHKGPVISRIFLLANEWRYYSWALVGLSILSLDPFTGILLFTTRFPAAIIIGVLNIQREVQRPPAALILRRLAPEIFAVLAIGNVLVWTPHMPAAKWALYGLVVICFLLLIYPSLPRQIRAVRHDGAFGVLRRLQEAQLFSYAASLVYALFVTVPDLGWLMLAIYCVVTLEQGVLVFELETRTAAWKREQKGGIG